MSDVTILLGLGEIGKPLYELLKEEYNIVGIDIEPVEVADSCDVMHVCYPFEIPDFVGVTADYMTRYDPALTIINSTVGVGTTRRVYERTGKPVVNSPIRGKHAKMKDHLLLYTKFIGGLDRESSEKAARHFRGIGMNTRILPSPEATELAKLTETTYFGYLIAWAQEIERYARAMNLDYQDIVSFYDEVPVLPKGYFPGVIGGHCVMPNIRILKSLFDSDILDIIEKSNTLKKDERGVEGWSQL